MFGSWAERYEGIPGPLPEDIDVLVIGGPEREAVYDAANRAREIIGLEVDVLIRSEQPGDRKRRG